MALIVSEIFSVDTISTAIYPFGQGEKKKTNKSLLTFYPGGCIQRFIILLFSHVDWKALASH